MGVFKGQMTKQVTDLLNENNIKLQKVPANLSYLFEPLDVQGGPNGHAKRQPRPQRIFSLQEEGEKEVLEHFKHVTKICPNRGYTFSE